MHHNREPELIYWVLTNKKNQGSRVHILIADKYVMYQSFFSTSYMLNGHF